MPSSFINETELPGRNINKDTLQIIAHRYYWASQYSAGKKVLEVGCGPGLGLGYLAKHSSHVIGGDITWENLAHAKKHYGSKIDLVHMDAQKLPFKDKSLDVIICVAAIIYIDANLFLKECQRVLKTGGVLAINSPNKDIPGFRRSILSRQYLSVPEWHTALKLHCFDFTISGAFNIPTGLAGLRAKLFTLLVFIATNILKLIGLFEFIQKRMTSFTTILSEELSSEIEYVKNIKNCRIENKHDQEHRIIYILATKK